MKELPVAFAARMKQLLGEEEFRLYEDSFCQNAVRAFRVNTEKISVKEFAEIAPFSLEPVPYVETGFYLDYDKIGNHPFHHAGMIYAGEMTRFIARLKQILGFDCKLDFSAVTATAMSPVANYHVILFHVLFSLRFAF